MEILPKIKNFENFSSFFDEILNLHGDNVHEDFLTRKDCDGETILHLMTEDDVKGAIFEFFVNNIFELENSKNEKQNLKIFFTTNKYGNTFLHRCIRFYDKNFDKFEKVFEFIKRNFSANQQKEIIKMRNKLGRNILLEATFKDEKAPKFIFNFIEKLLEREELQKLFLEKDEDGNSFLHLAALGAKSKDIFEFLWIKVCEVVENPREFFMQKGEFDRNVFQHSSANQNDQEIFSFTFNLAKKFCEGEKELKNLILEKNSKNLNLLSLTATFAPKSNLRFLFGKIFEIFGENEIKKLLKTLKGFKERNLLTLNAISNKNLDSIEFLWEIFENYLSREEIFELSIETDVDGNNFLHVAAFYAKSKEIFEFLWMKVEKYFDDDENMKNYLNIKDKWALWAGKSKKLQKF